MCGLAGFIHFKNAENLAEIAGDTQKHRGPDAQKAWQHNNITFAHQRLSIIDISSRSDQPFVKDGLSIIFNGEIYNYEELKALILLDSPDTIFHTTSDTEVLLELYRLKKEKCLDHLTGMFAFAIYELETGGLFIARDHFGIKPLFYTVIDGNFAFSSELKTLVKIPGFDKTINKEALVAVVNFLWLPGEMTMFTNCQQLPAAHYMTIDCNAYPVAFSIKKYWSLEITDTNKDEESATRDLHEVMKKTVARHMVADVPISCFLSGGLDSSLLTVMASELSPSLSTYTIGTSAKDKKIEQMPDDEKYARILADKFNLDHHEIELHPDILEELPKMVYTLDTPIGDPAAINTYLICKAAREKGVKVLLSGMGADEIFFGYRRQAATLLATRYKKIPGFLRRFIRGIVGALPVKVGKRGIRITRWAKRFISFADLPTEQAYMMSYSYYDQKSLQSLFKEPIDKEYTNIRKKHQQCFNSEYNNDLINQICNTDIHYFMQGLNLAYTDRSSMAASVEVRVPFIDREVVQAAMNINGSLKYKNKQQKYILKKVAEKYLPENIIYRPKASFGAPIRSWISNDLKKLVDTLLSELTVTDRGLFNYDYVKTLIENDRMGIEDNAYRIYQLLTIEIWFKKFIDE